MENDVFKIKLPYALRFDLKSSEFRRRLKKEVSKGVWLLKMELGKVWYDFESDLEKELAEIGTPKTDSGGKTEIDSGGDTDSGDFDGMNDDDDIDTSESDSSDIDGTEQFVSGVCIGSTGLILTCTNALEPIYRDNYSVITASVCGRMCNGTTFYKLEHVRTHGDFMLLRVVFDELPSQFHYVDITADLPMEVDSEFLAVALNGDETFTGLKCFVPADAGRIDEFVEMKYMPHVLPYPDFATENDNVYSAICGVCFLHHDNKVDNKRLFTTTSGSPVFDRCGRMVGIISAGIKDICFVSPFNTESLEEFHNYL